MKEILSLQNKWWETKSVPKELLGSFKREVFIRLSKDLERVEITSILGPRRAGKTIIMHQLIDSLLNRNIDEKRILYLQFDAPEVNKKGVIKELLTIISDRLAEPLGEFKERVYLFLDEVHKLETWAEEIKQFQDMKLNIKFVVSGSSSLRILKGSGESLIGRISHFIILPLGFREFLLLRGIIVSPTPLDYKHFKKTYSGLIHSINKIQVYFKEYLLKGGYPEIINKNTAESFRLLLDYKDLALQRDLFEIEGIRDIKSIRDLVSVLASLATERVNYSKLGSILGIKADTVKKYIGLLEDIYLITESKVFSKKPYFSVRKEKKIFFLDIGMLNAISMRYELEENNIPKLIENLCANIIFNLKSERSINPFVDYWLDEYGKEIDLILDVGKEVLPIEVKYKNQILKKDVYTLKKFLDRYNLRTGIIVTKDVFDKKISEGKEILYLPAWLFMLLL